MTDLPPLAELRQRYLVDDRPVPRDVEQALKSDSRAGAQAILKAVHKRRRAARAEGQRLHRVLSFERILWADGLVMVAGVDEAGMSPLAGPVVAAAVILPVGCKIRHVDDSKKLDARLRDELAEVIKERAVAWAIGQCSPAEIDEINIYHAGLLAMRRAAMGLNPTAEALLVDARTVPNMSVPQTPIIRGDSKSLSIAAASILAKTTRDRRMVQYADEFPGYGFAKHKGYPVLQHKAAIRELGLLPIHRRSFPVVQLLASEFERNR